MVGKYDEWRVVGSPHRELWIIATATTPATTPATTTATASESATAKWILEHSADADSPPQALEAASLQGEGKASTFPLQIPQEVRHAPSRLPRSFRLCLRFLDCQQRFVNCYLFSFHHFLLFGNESTLGFELDILSRRTSGLMTPLNNRWL